MEERCGAIVALKGLGEAKSRFSSLHPAVRRRLAELMAVAVGTALAPVVDDLVVVTAAPGVRALFAGHGVRARVLADPGGGLNAALTAGAHDVRARGCGLVIACVADLPALAATDVSAVLAGCTGSGRWFVADTAGTGTTMLAARGQPLSPAFGQESAARHRTGGALELSAPPGARRDADDAADLADAVRLGLQWPVSALVEETADAPRHETAVVAGREGPCWGLITAAGVRAYAPVAAVAAEVRTLATGQRVHFVRDRAGSVRHLWL